MRLPCTRGAAAHCVHSALVYSCGYSGSVVQCTSLAARFDLVLLAVASLPSLPSLPFPRVLHFSAFIIIEA